MSNQMFAISLINPTKFINSYYYDDQHHCTLNYIKKQTVLMG